MRDVYRPKGLASAVFYQDARAAFRWLERAFGFEPLFVLLDKDGNLGHSEMTYGNAVVMVGNEWSDAHRSPKSIGGKNTQSFHVQLAEGEDLDAHSERARAAGADILMEPELQFYGDRTYRARDPEGHIWVFAVTVKKMTPAEFAGPRFRLIGADWGAGISSWGSGSQSPSSPPPGSPSGKASGASLRIFDITQRGFSVSSISSMRQWPFSRTRSNSMSRGAPKFLKVART
jgi:uncharacterized glyoxalase superfamily protein PhnB